MIATADMAAISLELLPPLSMPPRDEHAQAKSWTVWAPRTDLLADCAAGASRAIRLTSRGDSAVLSSLRHRCPVSPGQTYRFSVRFRPEGLTSIRDSVRPLLRWFRASGQCAATDYVVRVAAEPDGWYRADQVVGPHPDAIEVEVHLMLRWTAQGSVTWAQPSLRACAAPATRHATLGVANVGVALDAPAK